MVLYFLRNATIYFFLFEINGLAMKIDHERPIVTIDAVVLALFDHRLHALLVRRPADAPIEPNRWSLPGGFVHTDTDQTDEDAVRRVLATKAGLGVRHLEQLRTFASATRDSRGWSVSIAFVAIAETHEKVWSDSARFVPIEELPELPFDHASIVAVALERVRNKASYSSLPGFFLPTEFTLPQFQTVYEEVLGMRLNTPAFRRKALDQNLIESVDKEPGEPGPRKAGRPAQWYRLSQASLQDMGRAVMLPDSRRGG